MDLLGPEDLCSQAATTIVYNDLIFNDGDLRLSFMEADDLISSYCSILTCRERLERYAALCIDVSMCVLCVHSVYIC